MSILVNLNDVNPAPPAAGSPPWPIESNIKFQAVPDTLPLQIGDVANGGGLFEIVTATPHGLVTGERAYVYSAFAAIGGMWFVTVIDSTHFTLNGSTYSSGWHIPSSPPTDFGGVVLIARDISAYMPLMVAPNPAGSPPTAGLSGAVPAPDLSDLSPLAYLDATGDFSVPSLTGLFLVPFYSPGIQAAASQIFIAFDIPTNLSTVAYPANMSGASGHCDVNPTATVAITINDNGTQIGTISVSTGGVFTFTSASGIAGTVAAGHRVTVVGPATPDATFAGGNVTLAWTR